ncbi:hypothetical protein [Bacillus cereus]|uniref:hypothetical protein n=1 Tax=Bacillus cereus TaxID=1396 RepID=UPI000BF86BF6|nr:hypothetical protein [Bacillus cereus]MEB9844505.1 hypothetical protein [Bacillus cereus]PEZ14663.1 hypothetical protein CN365_29225 [Bacillus cereus]
MTGIDEQFEEIITHELPTHKFKTSYDWLRIDSRENPIGEKVCHEIYPSISSYYEESLGLLRSTRKLFKTTNAEIKSFAEKYKKIGNELQKWKEECKDEEDYYAYEIATSRYLDRQTLYYWDKDIEINAFSSGMVVQLLSLFESTLHSICRNLMENDKNLPDIKQICRRDKGSVKYLKYIDKSLNPSVQNALIVTPKFEKLCSWIAIRNNIVHNNNEFKEELIDIIEKHQLPVSRLRNKFLFNEDTIRELADICGITMDIIIEEKLRFYCMNLGKE